MKILLDDGMQLAFSTGIGSYARYLGDFLAKLPETLVTWEDFSAEGTRPAARLAYLKYLSTPAYQKKLADFDVVHYANYALPKKHPVGTLVAVTVHDLAAFSHKETLPRAYAAYNRHMIRRAMRHADVIFTVSEAVRAEIAARFPHAVKRVVAVHPGHYTRATAGELPPVYENEALMGLEKRKFFLFIGTVEKRKDLPTLIRAYDLLQRAYPPARDYALVIAGRRGLGSEAAVKLVLGAGDNADIRLPGFVSDSDRAKLLGEAAALVFPSIYEGFGSPQTEAMAARVPLLLSDIPTNREVSGSYGAYFPVGDESALAALMKQVVAGTLRADTDVASARLARFDWQSAATKTKDIYHRFLKNKKD